jgi:exportin-2 (importin alpha re-exporter)
MQVTPETMQALSSALSATVSPDAAARRQAEEQLSTGESQPGFFLIILELVRADNADSLVQQAAGVYFKNAMKRLWQPEGFEEVRRAPPGRDPAP